MYRTTATCMYIHTYQTGDDLIARWNVVPEGVEHGNIDQWKFFCGFVMKQYDIGWSEQHVHVRTHTARTYAHTHTHTHTHSHTHTHTYRTSSKNSAEKN